MNPGWMPGLRRLVAIGALGGLLASACVQEPVGQQSADALASEDRAPTPDVAGEPASVLHFIAVHCDPGAEFPGEFVNLESMVATASEAGIRLTLMFTPQWADFFQGDPSRSAKLSEWSAKGHEIAMHHHSVYHPGTWDGYSDFEVEQYAAIMGMAKAEKQEKLGTLSDFEAKLNAMYPGMKAGCANAEMDKKVMPASITHDTCSGFYTTYAYPLGTRSEGSDPLIGVNDFVLAGTTANGVWRQWLGHGLISAPFIEDAEVALREMTSGAHGVVVHTKVADVEAVESWIAVLLDFDGAAGTSTVSEIIDSGRLPIEVIDDAALNQVYERPSPGGGGGGPPSPP